MSATSFTVMKPARSCWFACLIRMRSKLVIIGSPTCLLNNESSRGRESPQCRTTSPTFIRFSRCALRNCSAAFTLGSIDTGSSCPVSQRRRASSIAVRASSEACGTSDAAKVFALRSARSILRRSAWSPTSKWIYPLRNSAWANAFSMRGVDAKTNHATFQ